VVWAKGRVFLMSNWMVYTVTILRLRVNYALHHEYVEEGRFSIMLFLTSTLVRVEWSTSCSHCFNPRDTSCDRTLDGPRSLYGCDGGNKPLLMLRIDPGTFSPYPVSCCLQ